jgi:hypothetical protein
MRSSRPLTPTAAATGPRPERRQGARHRLIGSLRCTRAPRTGLPAPSTTCAPRTAASRPSSAWRACRALSSSRRRSRWLLQR